MQNGIHQKDVSRFEGLGKKAQFGVAFKHWDVREIRPGVGDDCCDGRSSERRRLMDDQRSTSFAMQADASHRGTPQGYRHPPKGRHSQDSEDADGGSQQGRERGITPAISGPRPLTKLQQDGGIAGPLHRVVRR
jgi:hypothetical protein